MTPRRGRPKPEEPNNPFERREDEKREEKSLSPPSHAPPSAAAADRALWYGFLQGVTPLWGRERPPSVPPSLPPPRPPSADEGQKRKVALAFPPLIIEMTPRGLDRAQRRRLTASAGREARSIDLHGETLEGAYRRFRAALAECLAAEVRILDVITGHGRSGQGGAIRRELPHWINRSDIRPLIIAAFRLHPANPGATRLLLRRRQRLGLRRDGGSGSETV